MQSRRIDRRWLTGAAPSLLVAMLAGAAPEPSPEPSPLPAPQPALQPAAPQMAAAGATEVRVFWERLVERYRSLRFYRDETHLTQVRAGSGADGAAASGARSLDMECTLDAGRLSVRTPASQLAEMPRRALPPGAWPAVVEALERQQDLWMAPHLALRMSDSPLKDMRPGLDSALAPVEMTAVTLRERPLLRLSLVTTQPAPARPATVHLWVEPRTMLIERVETEETLAGGDTLRTQLEIVPRQALSEDSPPAVLAEPAADPVREPQAAPPRVDPASAPPAVNEAPPSSRPRPGMPSSSGSEGCQA